MKTTVISFIAAFTVLALAAHADTPVLDKQAETKDVRLLRGTVSGFVLSPFPLSGLSVYAAKASDKSKIAGQEGNLGSPQANNGTYMTPYSLSNLPVGVELVIVAKFEQQGGGVFTSVPPPFKLDPNHLSRSAMNIRWQSLR